MVKLSKSISCVETALQEHIRLFFNACVDRNKMILMT